MSKIVFFTITPLELGGGLEKDFIEKASRFSEIEGSEIYVCTFDKKWINRFWKLLNIYYLGKADLTLKDTTESVKMRLGRAKYLNVANFKQLKSVLKKSDSIYAKNEIFELFILLICGKTIQSKSVIKIATVLKIERTENIYDLLHNIIYTNRAYIWLLSRCKAVQVINNADYNYLKEKIGPKKVYKIYNSIKFLHSNKRNTTLEGRKLGIAWVGRMVPQKGVNDLAFLIKEMNRLYPDKIVWHIAGDGEEKPLITGLASDIHGVIYYGHVPHEEINKVYQNCDLFISTSKFETFGNTIAEAQVNGLSAMAYNISGPKDIIQQGVTGWLVESKEQMLVLIEKLVSNQIELFTPKDIADYMHSKFSEEKLDDELYALLNSP